MTRAGTAVLLLCSAIVLARSGPELNGQESGDVVELIASGGRLAGRIENGEQLSANPRGGQIILQTESGGRVVLDNSSVARVAQSSQAELDAYHAFVSGLEDNPADHWRAVEWCQQQPRGKYTLEKYLRMHLLRIVELDPNDRKAAEALSSLPQPIRLVSRNDRWVDERLLMASHGYRYDRKWGSHLQSAANEGGTTRDQSQRAFISAYRKWENRLKQIDRDTAFRELNQLVAQYPSALTPLADLAKKEQFPEKRLLLIETVGNVPTPLAGNILILFAMEDGDQRIRDRAQALMMQPHYNRIALTDKLRSYLRHPNNDMVLRAATIMGELGTFNAVLPLIDALNTKHSIRNPLATAPGQMNIVRQEGGTGLSVPNQPASITRELQNREALSALVRITQPLSPPDMGFDEASWSNWYARIMTSGRDLRRDE